MIQPKVTNKGNYWCTESEYTEGVECPQLDDVELRVIADDMSEEKEIRVSYQGEWVKKKVDSGGEETSDYEKLEHLPSINDVTLKGTKTNASLNIVTAGNVLPDTGKENQLHILTASEKGVYRYTGTEWEKVAEVNGEISFVSVRRLGAYTYEATFDTIPEYKEINASVGGGCTSFIKEGKLYRNLDWNYDNTAEFNVITKDFTGMAFIKGLDDGELDYEKVEQLPYHINDGRNNNGIMVSSHILYNDFNNYTGSGDKDEDITLIPYFVLTNVTTMSELASKMTDYLANLKIPTSLVTLEYLMQFMVSDGTTTKVITPKSDGSGYEIVDISALPKLANFKWVNKATLERNDDDLQDRPTGIERWNLIESGASLGDLRFTKCYETNVRLDEFIGESGTTKESTDAELQAIYEIAHNKYLSRTRDGELWQTCHSVVYGEKGLEHLWTQEEFDVDYIKSSDLSNYYTKPEVDTMGNSKVAKTDIVNNLTETNAGKVLDARQGKVLDEKKQDKLGDGQATFADNNKVDVLIDDVTIGIDGDGNLELKDDSITNSKISENLKDKSIDNTSDDSHLATGKAVYDIVKIAGHTIILEMDTTTYVITLKLKDKENNVLSTQSIDLPLESLVLNVDYVDTTEHPKSIKIILQNGTITYVPVGAIVDGLVKVADIVDNLTSTNTDRPLSAKQGKTLNDNKQDKLVSGTNIKTINSTSLLGSGNIATPTGVKGNAESSYRTGNVNITPANIGLGNVVNTGDSATPVSGGTTKFTTGGAYTELGKKLDKAYGIVYSNLSTNHKIADLAALMQEALTNINTAKGSQVGVYRTIGILQTENPPGTTADSTTCTFTVSIYSTQYILVEASSFVGDNPKSYLNYYNRSAWSGWHTLADNKNIDNYHKGKFLSPTSTLTLEDMVNQITKFRAGRVIVKEKSVKYIFETPTYIEYECALTRTGNFGDGYIAIDGGGLVAPRENSNVCLLTPLNAEQDLKQFRYEYSDGTTENVNMSIGEKSIDNTHIWLFSQNTNGSGSMVQYNASRVLAAEYKCVYRCYKNTVGYITFAEPTN